MKSYFIIRYYFQILLKIYQRFSIYAFKKFINIPCYFSTSLKYSLMLFICISYTVFLKHSMQFVPREETSRKQQEVYPKGFRLFTEALFIRAPRYDDIICICMDVFSFASRFMPYDVVVRFYPILNLVKYVLLDCVRISGNLR